MKNWRYAKYREQIFFLTVLVIYFLQGVLYANGSIISQTALLVILSCSAISLWHFMLAQHKNKFILIFMFLLFLQVLYAVFYSSRIAPTIIPNCIFNQIKNISIAILPLFFFYNLSKKGAFSYNILYVFVVIFVVINILDFYNSLLLIQSVRNREDVVTNAAYNFVYLLPMILLVYSKRKVVSAVLLLISIYYIIIGNKRGALICAVFFTLIYLYNAFTTAKQTKRSLQRLGTYACILIFSIIALNYAYVTLSSNEYFVERLNGIQEGNSSGRDEILGRIWTHYSNETSIFEAMFGSGFNSSIEIAGNYAHNDWMELLSTMGLLGIIIYIYAFYAFYRECCNIKIEKNKRLVLISILLIWGLVSLFSMGFTNMKFMFFSIVIGAILGEVAQTKSALK